MSSLILAFESSCDETSVALVRDGREVVSGLVASQVEIHARYGGVVPEIASRAHVEALSGLTESALEKAGCTLSDVDAVAVTNTPGLIGALLTGVSFAKGLSYSAKKPLIPVDHIQGHVAANYLVHPELKPPFYALVISGGHTSLFRVNDYTDYTTIGATRDDAAGEAFDKAARVLGIPYPGGAIMDRIAREGNKTAVKFSVCRVDGSEYDFSFSGLKTAVINYAHNLEMKNVLLTDEMKADISASFTDAVVRTLSEKIEKLYRGEKLPLVLAGGVAANSHIRSALADMLSGMGQTLYMPPLSLCGDNAMMIGAQAFYDLTSGKLADLSLNAYA